MPEIKLLQAFTHVLVWYSYDFKIFGLVLQFKHRFISLIWRKFELIQALMLVLVHENIKRIQSKTTEKKWKHPFPHYKSMGVFLRSSRAANSVVGGPICPKFELIHNIMHVLVTSKFEKDRININGDYVMTSIF